MGKDGEGKKGIFSTCPRYRLLETARSNHENERLEKTREIFSSHNSQISIWNSWRFDEKHHLKVAAKTQNQTYTYVWHCIERNKRMGISLLCFYPQVYLAIKGNKYSLSFKLVRSNYISNRYNFVPVDWEEILGHILGEKKQYQMLSVASEMRD